MGRWGNWGLCVLFAAFAVNCKSSPKPDMATETAPPVVAFVPSTPNAVIRSGESRYPNLFSPDSFAVWVTPEVAAIKREEETAAGAVIPPDLDATAGVVNDHFYVFECHIASAFPDASIAYDSVGLRSIDTYLVSPEGFKISPIQRILGSHADEEQAAALKMFRRTNILVFPKRDILVNEPTIDTGAAGVRLVLEGFNSTFYFEWPAVGAPPMEEPEGIRAMAANAYAKAKVGFTELYTKLRAASHVFD